MNRWVATAVAAIATTSGVAACGSDDAALDDTTPVTAELGPDQPDSDGDTANDTSNGEADATDAGASSDSESEQATDGAPLDADATGGTGDADGADPDGQGEGASPDVPAPPDDELIDEAPEGRAEVEPPEGALTNLASGATTDMEAEIGSGLTLLWFWSPDSSTASREALVVQRYADTFAGAATVVAVGSGGAASDADAFYQSAGLDVTTVWSASDDAAAHYEVDALPQTILIDGDGNIIARWPGMSEEVFALTERIT